MQNFIELLHAVMNGKQSQPRGMKVNQIYNHQIEIDSHFPFLDFKSRPFNWTYFGAELAWFLKGETNIDFISKYSSFWKKLTNPESSPFESNTVNSNYGNLLLDKQFAWAFHSLIKDRDTRQAVCFFNRPTYQFKDNKDFVCTMYINFWIVDDKLFMKVQMRSNDLFFGFTYDVPWFAFIHHQMLLSLKWFYPELELGTYYHASDNFHVYEKHFDLANQIIDEYDSFTNPSHRMINPALFIAYDFEHENMRKTAMAEKYINQIYTINKDEFGDKLNLHFFEILRQNSIVTIN